MSKIISLFFFLLIVSYSFSQHFVSPNQVYFNNDLNYFVGLNFNNNFYGQSVFMASSLEIGVIKNAFFVKRSTSNTRFIQFIFTMSPFYFTYKPLSFNFIYYKFDLNNFMTDIINTNNSMLNLNLNGNSLSKKRTSYKLNNIEIQIGYRKYSIFNNKDILKFDAINISSGYQFKIIKSQVTLFGDLSFSLSSKLIMLNIISNKNNNITLNELAQLKSLYLGPMINLDVNLSKINLFLKVSQYYSISDWQKYSNSFIVICGIQMFYITGIKRSKDYDRQQPMY